MHKRKIAEGVRKAHAQINYAKMKTSELQKIASDIEKIISDSKATFFVGKGEKPKIPVEEALYELKAEISNRVSMYFYELLEKK